MKGKFIQHFTGKEITHKRSVQSARNRQTRNFVATLGVVGGHETHQESSVMHHKPTRSLRNLQEHWSHCCPLVPEQYVKTVH